MIILKILCFYNFMDNFRNVLYDVKTGNKNLVFNLLEYWLVFRVVFWVPFLHN